MKKRKLALATAIATLGACLSMFSSIPASAEWQRGDMVVFSVDVNNGFALVGMPENLKVPRRVLNCEFYVVGIENALFAPIAEQLKCGDVIRCPEEITIMCTCVIGVNSMSFYLHDSESSRDEPITPEMGYTMEIVGSVLEESFENIGSVTADGKTSIQVTDSDGIRYIFEENADVDEVSVFVCWECDAGYTGMYYDKETDSEKYSEELANRYNKESGRPIWIRENEDGDVNSDDTVDSADAAVILEEIALYGVGETGKMNLSESKAADVNGDGKINAQDAAVILSYSAGVGSGMLEGVTLKAYAGR